MPLVKSTSREAVSKNIEAEMASGKPRRQAIAIALDVQRRARKAAGGGIDMPFAARSAARNLERSGMIRSAVPGRTDALPMSVKSGAYVIPADIVSGIGQGNSLAGANALNKMFKTAPGGAAMVHPRASPMKMPTGGMMKGRRGFSDGGTAIEQEGDAPVDINAAGGEYLIEPEVIAEIGGGDIAQGHAILDAFVKQMRRKTIRALRALPGPKKN